MKVTVEYWYSDLSEKTGYAKHQEVAEVDIPKVVMDIFAKGLNVMLNHNYDGRIFILVDDKRFSHR